MLKTLLTARIAYSKAEAGEVVLLSPAMQGICIRALKLSSGEFIVFEAIKGE